MTPTDCQCELWWKDGSEPSWRWVPFGGVCNAGKHRLCTECKAVENAGWKCVDCGDGAGYDTE
jgi:hypothetical protein